VKLNKGKLLNAGIKEGFIITKIDRKPISSAKDVVNALQYKRGGALIEGVYPNGVRAYYGIGM
jgi:S1-C subfamily serine protease